MAETPARPFAQDHVIRWGDCDPAGIVYTPRVVDLVLETLEAFYRDVMGVSWLALNRDRGMGAPTVRLECDFIRAPGPDAPARVEVRVERVGRASVTFLIDGRDDGGHLFRATVVSCFIAQPVFESAPIPDDIRERLESYQAVCGDL